MSRIIAGQGPTIVLLHGVGDSAAGWSDFIVRMQDTFRLVAVDQRGHGTAPRFSDLDDPFRTLVDDALDVLFDEGPCYLIGHSMGGAVAAEAALRRPDLVEGLLLEDPSWVDRSPEEIAVIGEARLAQKKFTMASPATMAKAVAEKIDYGWAPSEAYAWAAAHYLTQEEFLATGIVSQSRPWKEVHDELIELYIPTVVATGTEAGVIVDKRELGLPYQEFSGAGHCIRRDCPTEFSQLVTSLIHS